MTGLQTSTSPSAGPVADREIGTGPVAEAADRERDRPPRRSLYHRRIVEIYRDLVPAGARVLDVGCGDGDLLASLRPSRGVGIELDGDLVERARRRHPDLAFGHADAHDPLPEGPWDVVILSHAIGDFRDIQMVLRRVRAVCDPETRIVVNTCSRLWTIPLRIVERLGLGRPHLGRAWLSPADLDNLMRLEGLEVFRTRSEVLCPVPVPLLANVLNRIAVKIWPFHLAGLAHFAIARPEPVATTAAGARSTPSVSVVVPVRNERGHLEEILDRLPAFDGPAEFIFVEGGSTDGTAEALERLLAARGRDDVRMLRQPGTGKGDAVRTGFAAARHEVLLILDGDLSVPPESLPRFVEVLAAGRGEFVNGVRLVYPMQRRAMRFMNLLSNAAFASLFSWVLEQRVKDTLCGTKALRRVDYERLVADRERFGDDPFGDFDLLFGAAWLNLRIVDLPVRYAARTYGETNIHRWRHGAILLRMLAKACRRFKFR
jgi:SAM-dependent methyltransferase